MRIHAIRSGVGTSDRNLFTVGIQPSYSIVAPTIVTGCEPMFVLVEKLDAVLASTARLTRRPDERLAIRGAEADTAWKPAGIVVPEATGTGLPSRSGQTDAIHGDK